MKALFGQPEAARVMTAEYAALLEQATIVARAIQTLETLREHGKVEGDDTPSLFVRQSWAELKRLMRMYEAQGVRPHDIDLGMFV